MGKDVSDASRLKHLEDENAKLRCLQAGAMLGGCEGSAGKALTSSHGRANGPRDHGEGCNGRTQSCGRCGVIRSLGVGPSAAYADPDRCRPEDDAA